MQLEADKNKSLIRELPLNPFTEGAFIVVDKPLKWTSFDVVNKFRYLLTKQLGTKRVKVGHAGTLDPLATGVVVLCTGKYTKRIEEVQQMGKEYLATIELGATTPSFDLESEIDQRYPTDHLSIEKIRTVLQSFVGEIDQVPPIFSAVKVDGRRAYELARKGGEVELKSKRVRIDAIELLSCDLPVIEIKVTCGKGTYIRALARDIGFALDSGAHLTALKRTKVGAFGLEKAIEVEAFEEYIKKKIETYHKE